MFEITVITTQKTVIEAKTRNEAISIARSHLTADCVSVTVFNCITRTVLVSFGFAHLRQYQSGVEIGQRLAHENDAEIELIIQAVTSQITSVDYSDYLPHMQAFLLDVHLAGLWVGISEYCKHYDYDTRDFWEAKKHEYIKNLLGKYIR